MNLATRTLQFVDSYKPDGFMQHPKVKEARLLLLEAERELRDKEKLER